MTFVTWCIKNWKLALTLLGIVAVLAFASFTYLCSDSRRERRIDERKGEIIGVQAEVNGSAADAKAANANVREAEKRLEDVRRNRARNVSVEEANRNRCLAYPESCK